MAYFEAFVGGTYQAISPTFAADQAVNVYAESRVAEGSAKRTTLVGTPGLRLMTTVGTVACRGWFSQDGRTFVVVGGTLYAFDPEAETASSLGSIADDSAPVSFASNGQGGDQVAIVGGGELKIFDLGTNTLSAAIALPFVDPVMVAFIDGYFLINQRNTPIVWYSALEDGTSWDALDFFARSGSSDNVVGIAATNARIWVLGSLTTTQFYDSGDADTPFLPYPGTETLTGLVTPWALTVYQDRLAWVAQSGGGAYRVVMTQNGAPVDISTPPITRWLQQAQMIDDAETLVYSQEGHVFVSVTVPSSPDDIQTYVYDVTEQLWHARAGWNGLNGVFTRWRARGSTATTGKVFVGDFETGALYALDTATYTDNGGVIRRLRATPYLSPENQWIFVDQFELGAQAGVGLTTGQGSDPVATLEISRDAGRTWVSAGNAGLGASGDYGARAIWRRLGRVRGDRLVFRVTQTDPVKTAWTGAWVKLSPGTGRL